MSKRSILSELFRQEVTVPMLPIKDCRNCTYYRPSPGYYGFCNKLNENLVSNQAPLCAYYMPFGQVTTQIDASMIISGLLGLDRIPRVTLPKLPLGTLGYFLKGQGVADSIYALLVAADIPDLDAAKIVSGILALARIPNLDWAHISALFPKTLAELISDHDLAHHPLTIIPTMDDAHIPTAFLLDGSRVMTGVLKGKASAGGGGVGDLTIKVADSGNDTVGYGAIDLRGGQAIIQARPGWSAIFRSFNVADGWKFIRWNGTVETDVFKIDPNGQIILGNADAALIASGILALARIPNMDLAHIPTPLTGKDADSVDTYHASALEKVANKGIASGYCDLDASILVPIARVPTIPYTKTDFANQALSTTSSPTFVDTIATHRFNAKGDEAVGYNIKTADGTTKSAFIKVGDEIRVYYPLTGYFTLFTLDEIVKFRIDSSGVIQPYGGYKSSAGVVGVTADVTINEGTLYFQNGLYVGKSW